MTTFEMNNAIESGLGRLITTAAYIRVSTQEQKLHGLSLDAQRMKIEAYAKKHGYKITEWYVDEGVSGRKLIRNRPELQRMIQDAEKGNFEKILFIKLDRFFRSVAEYHECMKRIAPVEWETTEEEYNLSTANGRMLVNMKLTIAELEADQTGERIRIVNDYKVQTGQPLFGNCSMPFGFKVGVDEKNGKKNVIRDPETEAAVYDLIAFYLKHQSKVKTLKYIQSKYNLKIGYNALTKTLTNPMLCGAYRDNPAYCEGYIDKATFDRVQEIIKRNVKENTAENRAYYFTGLIKCPKCGCTLKGGTHTISRNGHKYVYKNYRCANNRRENFCHFNKAVLENRLERLMLENIEIFLDEVKAEHFKVAGGVPVPKHNVEEINAQIDRLNYSWQTGKIRTVEQYENQFADLQEQLKQAEAEREAVPAQDFGKVDAILNSGWREVYKNLDDEYKRAFWRSFIRSIEIEWTTETKRITRVEFF